MENNELNQEELTKKVEELQQEIESLKIDKADLEIVLETITEHSTNLENEIYGKNEILMKYLKQVEKITRAAAAIEQGTFEIESLNEVAARDDQLGQLARVFQNMVKQIKEREEKLKQQVEELKIEIDKTKKDKQVAEILETDNFKNLKRKLNRLKNKQNKD
ncbi:HAMP domain-containing protein [Gloeothece verrucosa]|uniref:Putative sensor with HAMP domain n=1 Tax=Gloeothece verrucosa (strain PCC 7822) TaxID=497965 RepID=E0U5L5_GLOV7|nr:HAMP domain-containing protein [Gloeothece verrucosa]ADN14728.1 putative sensor with HAMP domain [Gloeothece verrucosa PCC 7822]